MYYLDELKNIVQVRPDVLFYDGNELRQLLEKELSEIRFCNPHDVQQRWHDLGDVRHAFYSQALENEVNSLDDHCVVLSQSRITDDPHEGSNRNGWVVFLESGRAHVYEHLASTQVLTGFSFGLVGDGQQHCSFRLSINLAQVHFVFVRIEGSKQTKYSKSFSANGWDLLRFEEGEQSIK